MVSCRTRCSSRIASSQYNRISRVWICIILLLLALSARSNACPNHGTAAHTDPRRQRHVTAALLPAAAVTAAADDVGWIQYEEYSNTDLSRVSRVLLSDGINASAAAEAAAATAAEALEANSSSTDQQRQQQQQLMNRPGPRCGVRNITALEHSSITFKLQKARMSAARLPNPAERPGTMSIASMQQQQQQQRSLTISVYFHVISGRSADTTVNASPELLAQQLAVMNSAYGRYNIRFALKGVTRVQSDTWAVTEINSDSETAMKNRLRRGGPSDLNIYFIRPSSGTLGWSTFPWEVSKLGQAFDGVVVHVGTLPGGTMAPYNKGYTLVHEVGHWLGLLHVFENGCSGPGDSVDDTPAQASAAYGCPLERKTCPGTGRDPVTNYMGYTDDACMTGFTRGQADRILDLWTVYRGVLDDVIVTESGSAHFGLGLPSGPVQQPVVQQPQPQPQQQQQSLPVPSPRPPAPGLAKLLPALFRRNFGQKDDDAAAAAAAGTSPDSPSVSEDAGALYSTAIPQDPAALFAQQQAAVAAATGRPVTTSPTYMQQQQQQQQPGLVQGYLSTSPLPLAQGTAGVLHNTPSFTTTYRPYNAAVEASLPPIYGISNPTAATAAQQALQAAAWSTSQQQLQQQQGMQYNLVGYSSSSNAGASYSTQMQLPAPNLSMPGYIQAKPARSGSSSSSSMGSSSSSSSDLQAALLASMGAYPVSQPGRKLGSISERTAAELLEPFPAVSSAAFDAKASSIP